MRKLFIALLLLIASMAAALWLRDHQGFVILKIGEWSLQTSLVVFAAALLVAWAVLSLAWTLVVRLVTTPRGMRRWIRGRRRSRSRERLVNGLIQLAEGHYEQAERMLTRQAEADELALFHYLLAAIAAHRRDTDQRDRFLSLADESEPGATVAVGLLQAQLQLESRQWEKALATLSWLHERAPGNRRVLSMLYHCSLHLEDWERARALLPELRRNHALPDGELSGLENRLAKERLDAATGAGAEQSLASIWQGLSRAERREPELRAHYARCLIRAGSPRTAAELLRGWLRHDWDDRLVEAWGELDDDHPGGRPTGRSNGCPIARRMRCCCGRRPARPCVPGSGAAPAAAWRRRWRGTPMPPRSGCSVTSTTSSASRSWALARPGRSGLRPRPRPPGPWRSRRCRRGQPLETESP
ncbi:MAG: heme biosynthesis HemY N-terminal domain-containing protein [Arhodomonas sp.]|nr:heme biosynthesis HemY N-terminal domain-containing protein [Arhodomonas sp.]